jgi:two-component system chemotaxis response regulator CheY
MGKRVMVVDDSTTVRQEVVAILGPAGFDMLEAMDGEDGLKRLESAEDIALVLCDVNMPRMNGIEMLRLARERGLTTPFVMLTTEGQPELIARAKSLGAKGWIVKPFAADLLIMAVKKLTGSDAG